MTSASAYSLWGEGTFWLEPAASTSAEKHDAVFRAVSYTTGFFFFLVVALMLLFIVRYRRQKKGAVPQGPTHNTLLEIVWTAIPLIVVTVLFVMGFLAFLDLDTPPSNAEVIDVDAQQWSFTFNYANGAVDGKLYLRVDRPVLLRLKSRDVLHALYIPAFRIQRNAIPGRTTELWFQPTRIGSYHIFCTQYCGNGHSLMTTEAVVLDEADYSAKLAQLSNIFVDPATKAPLPYAAVGARMAKSSGCLQCHSTDGTVNQGPTWQGLFKRDHEFSVAPSGYSLSAQDDDAKWDAYLRESVLDPAAKVVRPFQNVMQPYRAQFSGSPYKDKKLAALVEYVKSLDNHGPGGKPKYYRPMPTPVADDAAKPTSPGGSKPTSPAAATPKDPAAAGKSEQPSSKSTRESP